ncbi:MAG: hypothetical protein ABEJ92_05300 [Halobacteriales archaeon]
MQLDQLATDGIARRYDYSDRTVFVADLGPGAEPAVDVVDGTVIVVDGDGRQQEFDLPEGEVRAFNRHGVVTIEVRE